MIQANSKGSGSYPKSSRKSRGTALLILLLVVAATVAALWLYKMYSVPDISTSEAFAGRMELDNAFREKNPLNVQAVGILGYSDGSYNILLTEPPEEITKEMLDDFFKKYNGHVSTFMHRTGYDGWLCDAVASVNDLEEDEIDEMARKLSKLLFGTDYKASLIDLKTISEHRAFCRNNLNLEISAEDLRSWLIEGDETFSDGRGGPAAAIDDLLRTFPRGVYYSTVPGLVLWTLSAGYNSSEEFRANSRKFALDADIVLGALKKYGYVAIIGREREESLHDVPPMRGETLSLLASTPDEELNHSFDLHSLFAGKLTGSEGGKDWSTIRLSDALWHTEFGNELNASDVMLKSWSENGALKCENFNYPNPGFFPFDYGAIRELRTPVLTYNWNTQGAGYIEDDGDYEIYARTRTGSLPVSFIPGDTDGLSPSDLVYMAEDTAWDYFSSLSNTTLFRVAQYTAMYQIFKNMEVALQDNDARAERLEARTPTPAPEMYEYAEDFIKEFCQTTPEKIEIRLRNSDKADMAEIDLRALRKFHSGIVLVDDDETFIRSFSRYMVNANESIYIDPWKSSLKSAMYQTVRKFRKQFGGGAEGDEEEEEKSTGYYEEVLGNYARAGIALALEVYRNATDTAYGRDYYKNLYCKFNEAKHGRWIKCPSVVVSWNLEDSLNITGGHNLATKVNRFKINRTLKPGTVKYASEGARIVEASAQDIRSFVGSRSYQRSLARLGKGYAGTEKVTIKPRNQVIRSLARTERGAANSHFEVRATEKGYELGGRKVTLNELLDDAARHICQGEGKTAYKEIVITGVDRSGAEVEALIDGVSYRMAAGDGAGLRLARYDIARYTTEFVGDRAIVRIPLKANTLEYRSGNITEGFGPTLNMKLHEGFAAFNVPKAKLQEFIAMLKEFFREQGAKLNRFRLEQKMRRRGISPDEIEESTHLRFAKTGKSKENEEYAWMVQKEEIA